MFVRDFIVKNAVSDFVDYSGILCYYYKVKMGIVCFCKGDAYT